MSNVKQDLLVVIDATASMGSYLTALTESMPEILTLSKVSGAFERIGVMAYRDYCDHDDLFEWSEWNNPRLSAFTSNLSPIGGGDYPEAAKTGLIRALQNCDSEKQTLILWYADAPPHSAFSQGGNAQNERKMFPTGSTDWVKLVLMAKKRNCSVFSFIPESMAESDKSYYALLSQVTGGACLLVQSSYRANTTDYSRLTLDIVIHWTGLIDWNNTDVDPLKHSNVSTARLQSPSPLDCTKAELSSEENTPFLPTSKRPSVLAQITRSPLNLCKDIPASPHAPLFLSHSIQKRFADPANEAFRSMVYVELENLIDTNVYVLTYNSVFGQLWRAVCKYGDSTKKLELANTFSLRVAQITDEAKRADMQKWLEESFDATEEIEAIVRGATVDENTVWVYLDLDSGVELTRKEMLEVARSCYAGVLKKLATIFTHLKVVDPAVPLPSDQRKLPLSLPPRELYRLLPHLVVPGTLFPPRAAALTAILALVTGVPFLATSATALLETTRGTWLDLEVPENVSYDCAKFLLTAPEGVVLTPEEKEVYAAMRRYRLLELNLESTVMAQVPWTPEKTREVGDSKVMCRKCKVNRSVTIMSHDKKGVCGLCCVQEIKDLGLQYPETDDLNSCWVECSVKSCRAQYIVEDVAKLRVRPKCHYCRTQQSCPYVECTRCTNRVIVPTFYHTPGLLKTYLCPGCANTSCKHPTIAPTETTTKALVEDNGVEWLSLPPNPDLLQGKSAFKLVDAHGFDIFRDNGKRGTAADKDAKEWALSLRGKKVHNAKDVLAQIEKRIGSGEIELGACALCFDDKPRGKLIPCCGRKGCAYRVDEGCLQTWYGANEPGKLLNLMQLVCPFCRRMPSHKILARFNRRVVTLGGLRDAIAERGWYHAWCMQCGFAKRAYERQCCEGGRLPNVAGFLCEGCTQAAGRTRGVAATSGEVRVMACPGCGVMVEKTDGCNHISCPCGQHFCYVCGKGSDEADIYTHMSEEHGGIYDEEEDRDWDED